MSLVAFSRSSSVRPTHFVNGPATGSVAVKTRVLGPWVKVTGVVKPHAGFDVVGPPAALQPRT
jgi:hypothetical protein